MLGRPALRRSELAEALGKPGGIRAKVLPVVAVPFQGFGQLGRAEAGTLETVAHGTAEFFVGVAAEAEFDQTIHVGKVGRGC
jgi:hypothetical protein